MFTVPGILTSPQASLSVLLSTSRSAANCVWCNRLQAGAQLLNSLVTNSQKESTLLDNAVLERTCLAQFAARSQADPGTYLLSPTSTRGADFLEFFSGHGRLSFAIKGSSLAFSAYKRLVEMYSKDPKLPGHSQAAISSSESEIFSLYSVFLDANVSIFQATT